MSRPTATPTTNTDTDGAAPSLSARGSQRTEQIARAAAHLFQDLGYQNVSIDQIGAAVGLTGPAVYRHFKGKYAILVRALQGQTDMVAELEATADRTGSTPREQLDLFLEGLGDLTANGDEATLWRRERRHLRPAEFELFRDYFAANRDYIAAKIIAADPAIDERKAELLGFAVLTMYSNTPDIRGHLSPERLMEIQAALARTIIECPLPDPSPDAVALPPAVPRRPAEIGRAHV